MGVDEAIVIDQRTFKSLASETRVRMLKLLGERRHTLSEVAGALGMSLANASEHLEKLSGANLVRQVDEGRKWKYYELTKNGKAIVSSSSSPYPRSVVIVLAISLVGLLASMLLLSGVADFVGGAARAPMLAAPEAGKQSAYPSAPQIAAGGAAEPLENAAANESKVDEEGAGGAAAAQASGGGGKADNTLVAAFAAIFAATFIYCIYRLAKIRGKKKLIE